jgi:hypothetical protein
MTHTHPREWLYQIGFKPSYKPGQFVTESVADGYREIGETVPHNMITTPGAPDYQPPLIPTDESWLPKAQRMAHQSFLHLVADIWTQLLVLKRDSKEKSLYLLWDAEIPQPTPATALAWLLTCEAWPMPNAFPNLNDLETLDYAVRDGEESALQSCFPMQSFLLPQSTPWGHASNRPIGFARGPSAFPERSLSTFLGDSMHREDRIKMELVRDKPVIHRPQMRGYVNYLQHTHPANREARPLSWYANGGWPYQSTQDFDQGITAHEIQESHYHNQAIEDLRKSVMIRLLTIPGLPSHKSNLHQGGTMWIRNWSENGIVTKSDGTDHLPWTVAGDSIGLAHGAPLSSVPAHAPRVWFGWSHVGPKYEFEEGLPQKRVTSDSEHWAQAYLRHRGMALSMLFKPNQVDMQEHFDFEILKRGDRLKKAGRIKAPAGADKKADERNDFAKAFNALMKKED